MEKKLIDLHFDIMKTELLPRLIDGLCSLLKNTKYKETLSLFHPTDDDFISIYKDCEMLSYWGSGLKESAERMGAGNGRTIYTPRRQSIVLLICAMHGEI